MADENEQLPEGTDKIIAGPSSTGEGSTGGSSSNSSIGTSGSSGGAGSGSPRTVTADTTLVTEKEIPAPKPDLEAPWTGTGRRSGGGPRSDTGSDQSSSDQPLSQRLRSSGEKLQGQAVDKARGLVGQGLERSSEALANVSRMIGDTASGIDERLGSEYGDYARRAAGAIDNAANSLASKNPEELIDDTRNFVRKSPGVALAGAAIVGFAIARLLKSSLGGAGQDESSRSGDSDDR